jgi:hypothetical protein
MPRRVAAHRSLDARPPHDGRPDTFPFDQTLEALEYVKQGHANGKAVITLD